LPGAAKVGSATSSNSANRSFCILDSIQYFIAFHRGFCVNSVRAEGEILEHALATLRTECLHKSFHQTSTQEYLVSRCLAFGYTLSLVTLRLIRTLQKSVHNMDDTDKEPVSNLCGHCGAFVFAQLQRPLPSQYKILSLFLLALANKNKCPSDCTRLAAACSFSYSSVFSFCFLLLSFATTFSPRVS
jgi:hypothetical protein